MGACGFANVRALPLRACAVRGPERVAFAHSILTITLPEQEELPPFTSYGDQGSERLNRYTENEVNTAFLKSGKVTLKRKCKLKPLLRETKCKP